MLDRTKPDPLRAEALDRASGVRHGFFTRGGGVSEGIYRSLNVGAGSRDDAAHVRQNRARVAAALAIPPERLVTVHQVHSPDVVVVREPFPAERPKADAIVTDRSGLALAVLTADCGPVLYADRDAGVIGAAHAGWHGALSGVLEATVDVMVGLGARREHIVAVLGPSISQANYEVGPEFVARFEAADGENRRWFAPSQRADHALFDLRGYSVERLRKAGIQASRLGNCTYAEEDLFFSYRRATHRAEPDYGRQVSAIVREDR